MTSSPKDLAEKFNTHFSSVFTVKNLSSLPIADKVFHGAESEITEHKLFDEVIVKKS